MTRLGLISNAYDSARDGEISWKDLNPALATPVALGGECASDVLSSVGAGLKPAPTKVRSPGRAMREGRLMHERNPRVCSDCVTGASKPEYSWLRLPLGYYPAPRPAFYNVGSQAQDCI
jgi:hypothetical protein